MAWLGWAFVMLACLEDREMYPERYRRFTAQHCATLREEPCATTLRTGDERRSQIAVLPLLLTRLDILRRWKKTQPKKIKDNR